ncbi:unnamed protein product [Rotaria socialis]|uniref:Uncharacterized protein n=1 Tax=Rotaria socialis TaxID=392032 RepID=A0A821P809_9BILA|nr:unnamed protein product [Rotaria socialis]
MIDNWQTKKNVVQRSKSVPTIHEKIYIKPQSRIDTWLSTNNKAHRNTSKISHQPLYINIRPQIDTWQQTTNQMNTNSKVLIIKLRFLIGSLLFLLAETNKSSDSNQCSFSR